MPIPTRMICSICGNVHKFDFEVPNEIWEEVIIERFQKSPVCLECFTTRADERLLKWDDVINITVPCSLATQIEIQNKNANITFDQYSKAFYDGYHVKCDEINGIPSTGRCKIEYSKCSGFSPDVNSTAILKDFIEYLQDRNFIDDDVWQENDVIKEFLNEKTNPRRQA